MSVAECLVLYGLDKTTLIKYLNKSRSIRTFQDLKNPLHWGFLPGMRRRNMNRLVSRGGLSIQEVTTFERIIDAEKIIKGEKNPKSKFLVLSCVL